MRTKKCTCIEKEKWSTSVCMLYGQLFYSEVTTYNHSDDKLLRIQSRVWIGRKKWEMMVEKFSHSSNLNIVKIKPSTHHRFHHPTYHNFPLFLTSRWPLTNAAHDTDQNPWLDSSPEALKAWSRTWMGLCEKSWVIPKRSLLLSESS